MSYADDLVAVEDIIATEGQAVTLQAPAAGAYDPATTSLSGAAPAAVNTTGVLIPLSKGLQNMPGTVIQAGDCQLLLPGNIARPSVGTKATIGAADYTIVMVNPLNPGGTQLLYDCVIRGIP